MDAVVSMLEGLTLWHWVGIGIVLLTLEVAVGTFDLLWIAMAAFLTALLSLLGIAPGWQAQLVAFAIVAVIFVAMGRTVFKGLRRRSSTHPNLNARTEGMVGQRAEALTTFDGGKGRVKVGDSVWAAEQSDDTVIVEGDGVVITGADGTTLKIRLA
jgi:membrane protein implicated in regulation of membrane protease activity